MKGRNYRGRGSMGAGGADCRASSISDIYRQIGGSDGIRISLDCHAMPELSFVKTGPLLRCGKAAQFSESILFPGNS